MNELRELLRFDRKELLSAFRKSSVSGKGTPEHISSDREEGLREFLRKYFPQPHHIVKGNISDSYGLRSASIDAIVVNPIHPHTMLPNRSPFFLAAEGVDYAIELKPNLANKKEIERGLAQIRSVKKLRRRTDGLLLGRKKLSERLKELALQIPCVLFSERTYDDKRKLVDTIVSYYEKHQVPRNERFDMICSLDGTFVLYSSVDSYYALNADVDGLAFCDLGEDVLYYFLFFLLRIPPSTPKLKATVMSHYIDKPPAAGWSTYHDLNDRLKTVC